jgi:hypothetical protein
MVRRSLGEARLGLRILSPFKLYNINHIHNLTEYVGVRYRKGFSTHSLECKRPYRSSSIAKQHASFIYWLEVMLTLMHRNTLQFPSHMPHKIAT